MEAHRVILMGKTGNGKSSTGNSILGEDVFKSKKSSNAVTSQCAVHTREQKGGRNFTVCDTPALFSHGEDPIDMSLKLRHSVELCPKPHAFLLVFSGASRMTTDEKNTITLLRVIFGDRMFDHCIVVITRGNEFESQSEFNNFWTENDVLKKIVERCGNRVVKIENAKDFPAKSQLDELIYLIEKLASKGSYDQRFLKTHTEVLQEYKHTCDVSNYEDIDKHLNEILNTLEKKLIEEERRLEEQKRKTEEEKRKAEEENREAEDVKRKAEEEKRKAEEEKRKAEEERKRLEEEKRRAKEEEDKILKEIKQQLEEERRKMRKEEDRRRKEDELRIIEEERKLMELKQKLEEDRRKMREEEYKRRKEEEYKRMKEEEYKRMKEEERRLKEIKRQQLEEKRMREEECRKRKEYEIRRKEEEIKWFLNKQ